MKTGTLSVNMSQFNKCRSFASDEIIMVENIKGTQGKFFTFDAQPYMDFLNGLNVFYTFTPDASFP